MDSFRASTERVNMAAKKLVLSPTIFKNIYGDVRRIQKRAITCWSPAEFSLVQKQRLFPDKEVNFRLIVIMVIFLKIIINCYAVSAKGDIIQAYLFQ